MCFTRAGSHKHERTLEWRAGDKHSSLLQTFVNYKRKKFIPFGPERLHLKTFQSNPFTPPTFFVLCTHCQILQTLYKRNLQE